MLAPFLHKKSYEFLEPYAWKWLIWFFNQCDHAVVPTQTGADMFQEHGLEVNITPISNGIDNQRFTPSNDGAYLRKQFNVPDKPIVLYTGRINEEKSLDVFIKAIPLVLQSVDAHFLFVGSGGKYRNFLIDLSKKLKIEQHTSFISFLPDKDFPNIYSLAHLFVMPSEAELQSIVTLEALASGLPVVAVNKGAVPELVTSDNGLLFDSGNIQQLADQVIYLLHNDHLLCSMGKKSLEIVQNHTMDFVGSAYEQVYKSLLSS
jgi:glycosyltransferase involved in cell wall biosynthesis